MAEISDDSRGTYYINSQNKFKTSMLKSGSCDYNDGYIFVEETIAIIGKRAWRKEMTQQNEQMKEIQK